MIDTIAGAESSAVVYSIAETAKANNLKPYDYFEYLLTEIPKHMDDKGNAFLDELLPWSDKLPDNCRKKIAALSSGDYNRHTRYEAFTINWIEMKKGV